MKIKYKFTLIIVMIVSLAFAIGSAAMIQHAFHSTLNQETANIRDRHKILVSMIQLMAGEKTMNEKKLYEAVDKIMDENTDLDAAMIEGDRDSNYFYSNFEEEQVKDLDALFADEIYIDRTKLVEKVKDVTSLNAEGQKITTKIINLGNKKYYQSSSYILVGEDVRRVVVWKDIQSVYDMRDQQVQMFSIVYLILVGGTAFVSFLLSAIVLKPLSKLVKATKKISSEDLSARSQIKGDDEIGKLAKNFDIMAENLESSVGKIKQGAEDKDRFLGAFTHEMRTPMTSIIGYSDVLLHQKLDKEDEEDALNYINSEAKRLHAMAEKMLQIFVVDKTEIELKKDSPKCIVEDLVSHLSDMLAEKNIKISGETEEGECMLDSDLFRTLIINFIDNSRKAMEDGGRIFISQKMLPDGVKVTVSDNGKGIPKDALEHLTEAFYRVDKARSRKQGGAGLGLALSQKIVELHSGEMTIESELGKGTSVTVVLRGGAA